MIKRKTTKGFTLIELIVVIGIIALLSSMIVASISKSRERATNTGTIAQVREYQTAIGLYLIENQNRYPNVGDMDFHCIGSGNDKCLWVGVEISTEDSGPLVDDLEKHIRRLPFVNTPILTGTGTYRGLLYRCNDSQCKSANLYWPEIGVSSCTKGSLYYTGTNGVLCTELAEGGSDNN